MSEQYQQPVLVVVVTDSNGDEALYVDGELRIADDTIYATDIAAKTDGLVIRFGHSTIETALQSWPNQYAELLSYLEAAK